MFTALKNRIHDATYAHQGGGRNMADASIHCLEVIVHLPLRKVGIKKHYFNKTSPSPSLIRRGTDRLRLENFVPGDLCHNLVLLLDTPKQVVMNRAGQRAALDWFESKKMVFIEQVWQVFLNTAEQQRQRLKVIDGTVRLAQVHAQIKQIIVSFTHV